MSNNSTPSVVADALLPQSLVIGDLNLQPLTLGVYLFLDKIGSPLVRGGAQSATAIDMFRAVYALATPIAECLAYWKDSPETYDAAVFGFASRVQLGDIEKLGEKLLGHIQAAFATAAKTKPSGSGEVLAPLESTPAQPVA